MSDENGWTGGKPLIKQTWDGKPISQRPPYGATILVYRQSGGRVEFLILHRAVFAADFEGEWAWTPPSGARLPDEPTDACADRELAEETGLRMPLKRFSDEDAEWMVYTLAIGDGERVQLSKEHDRYAWVGIEEAIRRCQPEPVNRPLVALGKQMGLL